VKFLADEDVDKPIVERLRKDGHFVLHTTILQDLVFLTKFFQAASFLSVLNEENRK